MVLPATVTPAADFKVIARVEAVMALLNVAVGLVLAGRSRCTFGGRGGGHRSGSPSVVVKVHVLGAVMATPEALLASTLAE